MVRKKLTFITFKSCKVSVKTYLVGKLDNEFVLFRGSVSFILDSLGKSQTSRGNRNRYYLQSVIEPEFLITEFFLSNTSVRESLEQLTLDI